MVQRRQGDVHAVDNAVGGRFVRYGVGMGALDRLRRLIWRVEEASNELEYSAIEAIDRVEEVADEHTGGRVGRALETVEEESRELLHRAHLDGDDPAPEPADGDETASA